MIGRTLAHYRITASIGSGGMGEVYRATDTKLGREVALKVLPADMAGSRERFERFQREAKALAALDHPGIVSVYSVEEADGIHFLTMQLVEGEALAEVIPGSGLPLDRLVTIATALAEALTAAHEKGIIHRDLKPANIMVTPDGRVKVLDFGLAKLSADDGVRQSEESTAMKTREGVVMGTLPYMSPEQVQGRQVDERTDIFSSGAILYEMASGRKPFGGPSRADLISAILRDTPAPLTESRAELPDGLLAIVRRCLEKDPDARFQTMSELCAELKALADGERGSLTRPARARAPLFALVAVVVVLLGVVAFVATRTKVATPTATEATTAALPKIRSIAVLPLDNYSGDASQDYFAEGMTDELTADLARISELRVISRGSAMQFKGKDRPPTPEIAKTLDVDAIVEGSVQRAGDRVKITAQLIDARADRHLWANTFERSSNDILTLQDELARAIATEIHVRLTPDETSGAGSAPTVNPDAYDAYLKGRYFFNRPSDENLQKAITRFEDAIALSPDFVPALSGLSDAYLWAGYNEGFMTASEARPKAKATAEKAIELDDSSAEAHTSLAVFRLFYEYDWEGSEAEFRRAIELNPNYAYAHDQFALGLAFQGRFEESIAESRQAAELDPLSPQVPLDAAFAYTWKGDYKGAREQIARSAELDPTYFLSVWGFGWIDLQEGKIADAIPDFEESKAMGAPAFVSAWLAYAYGRVGDRERALAELDDTKKMSFNGEVTPFNLALVSLGMGENARAISYLEQAYASDSQWLGWLKLDRVFDPLRSDPRFKELMKRVNFVK